MTWELLPSALLCVKLDLADKHGVPGGCCTLHWFTSVTDLTIPGPLYDSNRWGARTTTWEADGLTPGPDNLLLPEQCDAA